MKHLFQQSSFFSYSAVFSWFCLSVCRRNIMQYIYISSLQHAILPHPQVITVVISCGQSSVNFKGHIYDSLGAKHSSHSSTLWQETIYIPPCSTPVYRGVVFPWSVCRNVWSPIGYLLHSPHRRQVKACWRIMYILDEIFGPFALDTITTFTFLFVNIVELWTFNQRSPLFYIIFLLRNEMHFMPFASN